MLLSLILRLNSKKKIMFKVDSILNGNPQMKGVVLRTCTVTPKKPNSARRPVAKISLSNRKNVTAHIPGIGHNLRKHSTVLIHGGGARDLPGVSYSCIRGVYDLSPVVNRTRRRSIYGVSLGEIPGKKLRRKFRIN